MTNAERLKQIRKLNELLEDYLDRCDMDEAEEDNPEHKVKEK